MRCRTAARLRRAARMRTRKAGQAVRLTSRSEAGIGPLAGIPSACTGAVMLDLVRAVKPAPEPVAAPAAAVPLVAVEDLKKDFPV